MWKVLTHENSATPQIKFQLRCREKDLSTIFLCGYVLRLLGRRIKDCDLYQWATLVGQTFLNHSWYNLLIESWNRPRGGLETEVHEVDLHLQIFFHRKTILRGKTGFFCRWPCLKSMNHPDHMTKKCQGLACMTSFWKMRVTMKVCILQWWNACSSKGAGRSFWFFLFFSPEHWKPANKSWRLMALVLQFSREGFLALFLFVRLPAGNDACYPNVEPWWFCRRHQMQMVCVLGESWRSIRQ